jgi:hypothetical protein
MNKTTIHKINLSTVALAASMLTGLHLRADEQPLAQKQFTYLDLQPKATQKLSDSMHGFDGNSLSELPKGEQTFNGVKFKIADSYIPLRGRDETGKPEKVEAITVGKPFTKLHILHGTCYGSYRTGGDRLFVEYGTVIGEYRLHYDDNSIESIPIVYGEDVRDWWNWDKPAEVTRGKIAWSGKNALSRQQGQSIQLYLTTWNNPHPRKTVLTVDYISAAKSAAAPFCVAISLED